MTTDREQWLARRLTGIGASDVAAARHNVYGGAAKVVGVRIGLEDPDPIDPGDADRGHRWEPAIADGVLAHTGLYVHGEQLHLSHPDRPRHMATPDGLLSPLPEASFDDLVAGLEVKTRRFGAGWQWDYWTSQSRFGIHVSGLPRWLLAVATIDDDFDPATGQLVERIVDVRYRWIERDPFEQQQLIDLADWLWSWVERGELPPATHAEALPWVKAANASADPDAAADVDDLAEAIERREELKAAIKKAQGEADRIEASIRERMGAATEAFTTDELWRVWCGNPIRKFTSQSETDFTERYGGDHPELLRTVLDRQAAKAAMPDKYEALKATTPDRRLTIKRMRNT